jgi:hypothetical protein
MSPDGQDQRQKSGSGARRSVRAVTRGCYLTTTAVVLAVAVCVALAPRALSDAADTPAATAAPASDDSVTWNPGEAGQNPGGGQCDITALGDIGTPPDQAGETEIGNLISALTYERPPVIDEPEQDDFDTNTQGFSLPAIGRRFSMPATGPSEPLGTTVTGQADVSCPIVRAGPAWSSGGVGVLAATFAWLAVSTVVIGATMAYGATLPASQAAVLTSTAVLAALGGCISGAVAAPVLLYIGGGDQSALGTVSDAVAGCLLYARQAQVSVTVLGTWLSTELSAVIPGASQIGGTGLAAAAASAGTSLSPMTTAMTDAAAGLAAAP